MKKDIALMASSACVGAYTGDSVVVKVSDADIDDVLNQIGESAIIEWLESKRESPNNYELDERAKELVDQHDGNAYNLARIIAYQSMSK